MIKNIYIIGNYDFFFHYSSMTVPVLYLPHTTLSEFELGGGGVRMRPTLTTLQSIELETVISVSPLVAMQ